MLLTLLQLLLFLLALALLLYPDLRLPDGRYHAVLKGMTISKTFLLLPFTARLLTLIL